MCQYSLIQMSWIWISDSFFGDALHLMAASDKRHRHSLDRRICSARLRRRLTKSYFNNTTSQTRRLWLTGISAWLNTTRSCQKHRVAHYANATKQEMRDSSETKRGLQKQTAQTKTYGKVAVVMWNSRHLWTFNFSVTASYFGTVSCHRCKRKILLEKAAFSNFSKLLNMKSFRCGPNKTCFWMLTVTAGWISEK